MNDKMTMFVPITKVDVEKREVWGVMAESAPDKSRERMVYNESKPYIKAWSDSIFKASDGKSLGNVRAMHGKVAAGKVIAMDFDDDNERVLVGVKVVDDNEMDKVREGVYTGFSVGGDYVKRYPRDANGIVPYVAGPSEVSLVDNPCMHGATFQVVKANGATEMRKFVGGEPEPVQVWKCNDPEHSHVVKAEAVECLRADAIAKVAQRKDVKPSEGEDKYGDVEFADAKNKKYPIDTEEHIRAAWNYINKAKNSAKYSASDAKAIKSKIVAAWKKKIDKHGPPSAEKGEKAMRVEDLKKLVDAVLGEVAKPSGTDWRKRAEDRVAKFVEDAKAKGVEFDVSALLKAAAEGTVALYKDLTGRELKVPETLEKVGFDPSGYCWQGAQNTCQAADAVYIIALIDSLIRSEAYEQVHDAEDDAQAADLESARDAMVDFVASELAEKEEAPLQMAVRPNGLLKVAYENEDGALETVEITADDLRKRKAGMKDFINEKNAQEMHDHAVKKGASCKGEKAADGDLEKMKASTEPIDGKVTGGVPPTIKKHLTKDNAQSVHDHVVGEFGAKCKAKKVEEGGDLEKIEGDGKLEKSIQDAVDQAVSGVLAKAEERESTLRKQVEELKATVDAFGKRVVEKDAPRLVVKGGGTEQQDEGGTDVSGIVKGVIDEVRNVLGQAAAEKVAVGIGERMLAKAKS
jgi:Family of unknown function (DUF6582)